MRGESLDTPIRRFARGTDEEAFWHYVNKTDGCWLFEGPGTGTNAKYGRTRNGATAHRYSYELHHGPIPDGLFVCHTCDTPRCVNPDHLFLGTHEDNMSDMTTKARQPRGEQKTNAKLTEEAVRYIREQAALGRSHANLAQELGVGRPTITKTLLGQRWAHVQ